MPTEPMGPVIVGVDGSPASLAAVDLAADEATSRVTPLVIVYTHAAPTRGVASPDLLASPDLESGREILAEAVARARAEHPGLSVNGELVVGEPGEALLGWSRGAYLVVLGQRAHCVHTGRARSGGRDTGGPWGHPLDSVALQMISRAEAPVTVHRPLDTSTTIAQPRPVLVGISGVDDDSVVELAFVEAALRGAPLNALHVWSMPDTEAKRTIPDESTVQQCQNAAQQTLADALVGWSSKYPEVQVRQITRHGRDVAFALTAASRSAQLVVVGCKPQPGLARLYGSVAHSLVHRAGCPVAVVNPRVH